jgi:hypothetical protein
MSKLRDEIAELVYVYANRRESGFAYPTDQMVANEILDKVREALLSDEVIRQVERGTHFAPRVSSVIVTAALNAVAGEGGER